MVMKNGALRKKPLFFHDEPELRQVAAGQFKATCLQLLDRAAEGESIAITKRGKVVARLVPPAPEEPAEFTPLWGRMKGRIEIHGDIVSPDFAAWNLPEPKKK
jgi:prevent-host-death family protein